MHVISVKKLRQFWELHADAKGPLRAWYEDAKRVDWKNPVHIESTYSNARPIPNNRVIFEIKGGNYRLVVAVRYRSGVVFIRFVGTHGEYDRIDAATI